MHCIPGSWQCNHRNSCVIVTSCLNSKSKLLFFFGETSFLFKCSLTLCDWLCHTLGFRFHDIYVGDAIYPCKFMIHDANRWFCKCYSCKNMTKRLRIRPGSSICNIPKLKYTCLIYCMHCKICANFYRKYICIKRVFVNICLFMLLLSLYAHRWLSSHSWDAGVFASLRWPYRKIHIAVLRQAGDNSTHHHCCALEMALISTT